MTLPLNSADHPLSEYFFVVPRRCLRIIGFWPLARHDQPAADCFRDKFSRLVLWPFANFLILFVGVLTELHAGFSLFASNLQKALETLCPASTSAVTLLKMLIIRYYRNELAEILQRMHYLLYGNDKTPKLHSLSVAKQYIIRSRFRVALRLNSAAFGMAFICCTTYNLKLLVMALYVWWVAIKAFTIEETPFNMTFPPVMFQYPWFSLTYLFTAYTGYLTILTFSGCDTFYFDFCSYLAALLRMLEDDFINLFRDHEGSFVLSPVEAVIFERRLVALIKRQNDIIALKTDFLRLYSIITLAHFVSASLVIGISIFDLLTFSGFSAIIYVTYTFAALSQLFMYCYGGTLVAENSLCIADVFGKCHWEVCPPRLRRYILIIIIRSQRQLTMAVPFFVPSLATFTSILRASASIIALASSFDKN